MRRLLWRGQRCPPDVYLLLLFAYVREGLSTNQKQVSRSSPCRTQDVRHWSDVGASAEPALSADASYAAVKAHGRDEFVRGSLVYAAPL